MDWNEGGEGVVKMDVLGAGLTEMDGARCGVGVGVGAGAGVDGGICAVGAGVNGIGTRGWEDICGVGA